jgi:CrcB protein
MAAPTGSISSLSCKFKGVGERLHRVRFAIVNGFDHTHAPIPVGIRQIRDYAAQLFLARVKSVTDAVANQQARVGQALQALLDGGAAALNLLKNFRPAPLARFRREQQQDFQMFHRFDVIIDKSQNIFWGALPVHCATKFPQLIDRSSGVALKGIHLTCGSESSFHHATDMANYFWIALGGALGSMARFWCASVMTQKLGARFPLGSTALGTLLVNVSGSFLIGVFAGMLVPAGKWNAPVSMRLFFATGVCGGFTTFSSFSLQTLDLAQRGEWGYAALNAGASMMLCLAAVWMGFALGVAINGKAS